GPMLREEPLEAPSGTLAERRLGLAVGSLLALPIGVLSGFTGVGGGEYRAPVLLALLGRVRWAIAANLLIGLCVAVFNVVFRQVWALDLDLLWLALLFVPTSLPAGLVGPWAQKRIPTRPSKALSAGFFLPTAPGLSLLRAQPGGPWPSGCSQSALGFLRGFGVR